MKLFNWMQNKFNGGEAHNKKTRPNPVPATYKVKNELRKEEFSDWPNGLLAIGTFGNANLNDNKDIEIEQNSEKEEQCTSPDLSEFTAEEVGNLQKELKKLLTKKSKEEMIADHLPLDRFLNCPSSLEVDRNASSRYSVTSDDKDKEEIDRTIRIILGRCKDVCEKKKKNKTIGKKSISFLLKKMFVCSSGFLPTPSLSDSLHESRMEKLLRTILTKKVYPQNGSRSSSVRKCIEENIKIKSKSDKDNESQEGSSRWDKTDSDFIVLEI